jgi:thiol-disulfide isomerase/thioredoxin
MLPPLPRSLVLALASVLLAGGALLLPPDARADAPANADEDRLMRAIQNPDSAAWAAAELRRMIAAGQVDSSEMAIARTFLTYALINAGAPPAQFTAAADSAVALLAHDPGDRAQIHQEVAVALTRIGDMKGSEARFRMALAAASEKPGSGSVRARLLGAIGALELTRGAVTDARATLMEALEVLPATNIGTRQALMLKLGEAHEVAQAYDQAIDAYVGALTVFQGADTSAAAPLRALWRRQHGGSLDGLEARLASAREQSRRQIVFDSRRVDKPAPKWKLTGLDGKAMSLGALKGRVVVVDFWGTWCGPCRLELPEFQKLYEAFRDRAAFLTVNVELQANTKDEHLKLARDYMKETGFTFPVLPDLDGAVAKAHGVDNYPTVLLIGRDGVVRYRNTGFSDGIGEIIRLQLESLLAAQ